MEIGQARVFPGGTAGPREAGRALGNAVIGKQSWDMVVDRIQQLSRKDASFSPHARGLGELLTIQREISEYQLKVELVSKLSESAVASIRKLQQNQ